MHISVLVFHRLREWCRTSGGRAVQSRNMGPKLLSVCNLQKKLGCNTLDFVGILYASLVRSVMEKARISFCTFKIDSVVKSMLRKLDKGKIGRN